MKRFAFVLDVIAILLFVAIGRHSHNHVLTWKGMVSTAWPFMVGLIAGWVFVKTSNRVALSRGSGTTIVLFTVVVGMILRVIAGQGTALTFILVALVFLSLFLVGWRWMYSKLERGVRS